MGYDVTVKFKTEEDREKMRSFILANSDILKKMAEVDPYGAPHDETPYNGEELGYAPSKKNLLGFHGTGIPKYIWDLCAWMAVKVECKDKKDNHFFYYDIEKMIVTFDPNDKKNTLVDSEGIPVIRKRDDSLPKEFISFLLGRKKSLQKQRELFVQLNDKWNEFVLENQADEPTKPKKVKP